MALKSFISGVSSHPKHFMWKEEKGNGLPRPSHPHVHRTTTGDGRIGIHTVDHAIMHAFSLRLPHLCMLANCGETAKVLHPCSDACATYEILKRVA